jgi:hypothetical protein
MKKTKFYKVYKEGGFMEKNNALFGSIAGAGASILDGFSPTDRAPSVGLAAGKGALSGAAMGSQFGPLGLGIGAGVGALYGGISGAVQRKQQEIGDARNFREMEIYERDRSNMEIANNPSLIRGNKGAQFYQNGGELHRLNSVNGIKSFGGELRPLSSDTAEVDGNSHEEGGVQLPQHNAELEGGETMSGPRIFSEALGFAKLHKPLARAIGKIEQKAGTPERINAIDRLKQKELSLYEQQEELKQYLNI